MFESILPMPLTPRHLRRYRQIAEVLIGHGFGAILAQLDLDHHLDLPRRLLRRPLDKETEITPAEHVRLALEELGPTFIKFGQILSTRPDLLPPAYLAELGRLQDQVPPEPWAQVKALLEEELAASLEQLFTTFDPAPFAAASLAQVHAATLPDGQAVVVKVQRPDIEKTINLDLDILYDLARLAQERTPLGQYYNLVELTEEFAITLRAELDYRREGRSADRFRANFTGEKQLYVPRVYWDYTSQRILVMERISGIKISDIEALDAAGYARRRIAHHSARFIIKEVLEDGFFHADPHPGNIFVMPGEVIGLMDFGTMGHLEPDDRANMVRLYIVAVQLDTAGIVDQLVRMGIASHTPDPTALQRDIRRLLHKYHGLPLADIRAQEVLDEVRPIVYTHRLRFPSDFWLLGKTLVMMEGVGLKLDPQFDMFAVSEPYIYRFLLRMWLPTEWGPAAVRSATGWTDLLADFPRQTTRLLNQMERRELGMQVMLPELAQTTNRLDRIANRAILSLLLAAFIMALALLIPTLNLAWPWSLLTWIILMGFGAMSVLGLWLIISILRSGGGL
ncbi:MAG: AarF/ABC1/UbiB kinase family protein [Chloroflexota bacterium]